LFSDNKKAEVDQWKRLMRLSADRREMKKWSKVDLLELFYKTPAPIIADAQDGRNVLACLRPVWPGPAIAGPVMTVKTDPTDWGSVVSALEQAARGAVLFIDSSGANIAVWGGLTSRAAKRHGLIGTIVYGGCRDVPTIASLRYPVWAKNITPRAGRPLNKGKLNVPINAAGIQIRPEDLLKADAHGVVVIPAGEAETVAKRVIEILQKERRIAREIGKGRELSELL
jgi:3-hexulose-6-phosphate synthase